MPASTTTKNLRRFVVGFWVVNLVGGLLVLAAWFWMRSSAKAPFISPTPTVIETASFTATLPFTPSATLLPTKTQTPTKTSRPTRTPTETITPIPFSEGPITIGESVKGLPLEVYRFGTGPIERLIVAGMHGGNEYNTVQLAEELIAILGKHPEDVPAEVTLYILHDLNPDGVARSISYLGRTNANGVDLNRNWPANWQADWPRSGCWTTTYVTGGTGPASEPETKALMTFIQSHHFDALINYHSAALGIFPGGIPISDASKSLAQAIAEVTTYPYPPVSTGCEYTGGMVDWTANQGIASLDIELTNHTDTDLDVNLQVLKVFLSWKP
jgi:murein peptide amidase A